MNKAMQWNEHWTDKDSELHELVLGIWQDIVKHIMDVLKGSTHGYDKFLKLADPSINEIVKEITDVDALLNRMLDGFEAGDLPVETESKLIDCQQCIHLIRRVHVALKHKNEQEYHDVIHKLRGHSSS